jgi:dihydroflavonol-4-reductase/farnesol dehydrogenase
MFQVLQGRLFPASKNLARFVWWLAFYAAKLAGKEPFFTAKGVNQIFCNKLFDCSKAIGELGYSITPFATALQQTIQFFKNNSYEYQ